MNDQCCQLADAVESQTRDISAALIADGRLDEAGGLLRASTYLSRVLRGLAPAVPQSETVPA